jgi:hypothetical protein
MSSSEIKAQGMIVKMMDGAENHVTLNTIEKLNFSESDMVVVYKSGSNTNYDLSNIRKLYFDASISVHEINALNNQALLVYPNPAGNSISVKGIPEKAGMISIYQMDGQTVMTEVVTSTEAIIDITRLPGGLYLLNALGRTTKFIKQ